MQYNVEFSDSIRANEGGQFDFIHDWNSKVIALEGGWGSGKSWAGSRKLVQTHILNSSNKEGRMTYVPSVCVAPTYSNAMDFCVPNIQDALDECGVSWKWHQSGSISKGKFSGPAIELPEFGYSKNPNCILVRTADAPERIAGFEVGAAWGDEVARWKCDKYNPLRNPLLQLKGRVRHKRARLLRTFYTYTNEGDMTEVYKEMRRGLERRRLYRAATCENPDGMKLFESLKDDLPPDLIEQYLMGGAASLSGGNVYNRFETDINVSENAVLREGVPIHLSVDFNINPGMHGILGQWWDDVEMFVACVEFYAPSLTVLLMVELIAAWIEETGGWRWNMMEVYGDVSGNQRGAGRGETNYDLIREGLRAYNIPHVLKVPRHNPYISDRVNAVNMVFKNVRGDIHYLIHPRCQELITDFRDQKWSPLGEIDKSDAERGHSGDAEGYRIDYLKPVRYENLRTVGGRVG